MILSHIQQMGMEDKAHGFLWHQLNNQQLNPPQNFEITSNTHQQNPMQHSHDQVANGNQYLSNYHNWYYYLIVCDSFSRFIFDDK